MQFIECNIMSVLTNIDILQLISNNLPTFQSLNLLSTSKILHTVKDKLWYHNVAYDICFKHSTYERFLNLKVISFHGPSFKFPSHVSTLDFGNFYDNRLSLPETVTTLSFNNTYYQHVYLPPNLISLTVGDSFNGLLDLPSTLIYLKLGASYNQPLKLPDSLRYLTISCHYNNKIQYVNNLEIFVSCDY